METVQRIRKDLFDTSRFEHQPAAFGFTEAMAAILDGVQRLERPEVLNERFREAWQAYAAIWNGEHQAALEAVVGEDRVEQLRAHPEMPELSRRIFERIGSLQPGQGFDVNVDDILAEAGIE